MNKILISLIVLCMFNLGSQAQRRARQTHIDDVSLSFLRQYDDSLKNYERRLDTLQSMVKPLSVENDFILFSPLTFYKGPAKDILNLEKQQSGIANRLLNNSLMNIYLRRPDLIRFTENELISTSINGVDDHSVQNPSHNIIDRVAPVPMEPDVISMDVWVTKPNFWTFSGDYYLQFLQNYISGNWYKGGESNYSMLGSVTLQANYNNKQKVKWDNKLELKLGYQTSRGDTLHKYKTSEDLLRYTGKLGLQAASKWYYTLQLIAYTQFTRGYKSNDPFVYSDFMSPFNLNVSVGMDYTVSWLNKKLTGTVHLAPFAFNWKYVDRLELSTRNGIDEGRHSLSDYGSEFTVDLTWALSDMVKWKTRMYGYTTYNRTEFEWENQISLQFNRYISANIFLYPRFDDGATRDTDYGYWEFKEYCSLGFSYSF